jgi:hypothetical protein
MSSREYLLDSIGVRHTKEFFERSEFKFIIGMWYVFLDAKNNFYVR